MLPWHPQLPGHTFVNGLSVDIPALNGGHVSVSFAPVGTLT